MALALGTAVLHSCTLRLEHLARHTSPTEKQEQAQQRHKRQQQQQQGEAIGRADNWAASPHCSKHLPTWKVVCTTYGFTSWNSNRRCTKKVWPLANCAMGSTPNTREWLAPSTCGRKGRVAMQCAQVAATVVGTSCSHAARTCRQPAVRPVLPAASASEARHGMAALQQAPYTGLTRWSLLGSVWKGTRPTWATWLNTFWSQACSGSHASSRRNGWKCWRMHARGCTHAGMARKREGARHTRQRGSAPSTKAEQGRSQKRRPGALRPPTPRGPPYLGVGVQLLLPGIDEAAGVLGVAEEEQACIQGWAAPHRMTNQWSSAGGQPPRLPACRHPARRIHRPGCFLAPSQSSPARPSPAHPAPPMFMAE